MKKRKFLIISSRTTREPSAQHHLKALLYVLKV